MSVLKYSKLAQLEYDLFQARIVLNRNSQIQWILKRLLQFLEFSKLIFWVQLFIKLVNIYIKKGPDIHIKYLTF